MPKDEWGSEYEVEQNPSWFVGVFTIGGHPHAVDRDGAVWNWVGHPGNYWVRASSRGPERRIYAPIDTPA